MSFQNKYELRSNKISTNSCVNEPDFVEICGFLQKFSRNIGVTLPRFRHLQLWLQSTDEFPKDLQHLISQLLQRAGRVVHKRQFDQNLFEFCLTYSAEDARALQESDGFQSLSLRQKLRFLKELLESLFDSNKRLLEFCERKSASELRTQPLGCDRHGCRYMLEKRNLHTWAVYKRSGLSKHFRPIARKRIEILGLISTLGGDASSISFSDSGVTDEDSNSSSLLLLTENEQDLVIFLKALSETLFE